MLPFNMLEELTQENENLIKNTFWELKTVCDEMVQNPNHEVYLRYIVVIDKTPNAAFAFLLEYVSFPLQFHLFKHVSKKHQLHSSVLIDLLNCLKKVLSKSKISSTTKFIEFCSILLEIVLEFETQTIINDLLEEVKCEVIDCLLILYQRIDESIILDLYDPLKRNICHVKVVFLCTQLARNEQLLDLRIKSLKCILTVARLEGKQYNTIADEKLRNDVAESIARMFPGIISTSFMIVTSSSMIHHSLYVNAISVFTRIVTLLFENFDDNQIETDLSAKIIQLMNKESSTTSQSNPDSIRSEAWYDKTIEKLITCTKGLVPVCRNLHWQVRLEMAKSAYFMLIRCSSKIQKFSTSLVEILIILSGDEMEQVSELAQDSLETLLNQDTRWSQQMLEFLEENLCNLLDSIIASLNLADESALSSNLNLLNGYLKILNLQRIFKSSFHFQRLITTLIKIARFDSSSLNSFQKFRVLELSISDLSHIPRESVSWKNSKYLNQHTETAIKGVFLTIAQRVDKQSLSYYLLDNFDSGIEDRKEIIYLINNLILSHTEEFNEEYFNVMKSILKTYLDPAYWDVPITSSGDDFFESTPLSVIHSNILQVCLLTEGIGNIAECLELHFKPLLLLCLYSIIENAGNPNEFISSAGLKTITKITSSCGYTDVSELITDNVDYVTYHITMKLRHLNQNKKVFDVLDVIILHCDKNSLSILCDIIEALLRSSDILKDTFREGFLKVMRSFVRKLRKWFAPLFNEDMCALNESEETLIQLLLSVNEHLHKNKSRDFFLDEEEKIDPNEASKTKLDEFNFDDEEDESSEINLPDNYNPENLGTTTEKDKKKIVPQHIKLIISVANRLVHVLSTKCSKDKILILEILMDSLLILCDEEDELLPVVHKIWDPLENRFVYDHNDPLILRRCFELLCVMAATARDFIRSRVCKTVLPTLTDFISRAGLHSKLKDSKSVYRMSQQYKVQRIMLRELGHLCIYMWLQEKELNSVLTSVTPYLSRHQPQPLQDACIGLFKTVAHFHFEFVNYFLMSVWLPYPCQKLVPPEGTDFYKVEMNPGSGMHDCKNNVTDLLLMIHQG